MTTKLKSPGLLYTVALCAIYPMVNGVAAPPPPAAHSQHAPPANTAANANPEFARTMMESMAKMDHDMAAVPMTGDPDQDFAAMMIPHHQGAIDMAKPFLLHGKDPALRRLAGEIIVAQDQEIKVLQARLTALRAGTASTPPPMSPPTSAAALPVSSRDRVYTSDQIPGDAGNASHLSLVLPRDSESPASATVSVNQVGPLDLLQLAVAGLKPSPGYVLWLVASRGEPFGEKEALVTFNTNLAGAQVAQAVGPLRQVLSAAVADPGSLAEERFLLVTQADSEAPELIQREENLP